MKIRQIYERFEIMPQLQTHMLRVAGIAKLITHDWDDREIAAACIKTCLLHDMGNMAKFILNNPIIPIDNLDYWIQNQKKFWQKYGHDAHAATDTILKEMGLDVYARYLEEEGAIYSIDPTLQDFQRAKLPVIILLYADLRVATDGVVPLQTRIDDLAHRYGKSRAEQKWGVMLEKHIQTLCNIKVDEIVESDVVPLYDELLETQI